MSGLKKIVRENYSLKFEGSTLKKLPAETLVDLTRDFVTYFCDQSDTHDVHSVGDILSLNARIEITQKYEVQSDSWLTVCLKYVAGTSPEDLDHFRTIFKEMGLEKSCE